RSGQVGEEHHAEARVDRIERLPELVRLRVPMDEGDAPVVVSPARRAEQLLRDVDADHAAGRTDRLGELQGGLPAAAAAAEDGLSGAGAEGCSPGGGPRARRAARPSGSSWRSSRSCCATQMSAAGPFQYSI